MVDSGKNMQAKGKGKKRNYKRKRRYNKKKSLNKSLTTKWGRKDAGGSMTRYVKNDPFPPTIYTKLTYADENVVATPANSTQQFGSEIVYSLNNPYQPYAAGGIDLNHNSSALGLAELANLYFRYKVHAVQIRLQFYHPHVNTTSLTSEQCGIIGGVICTNPSGLSNTLNGSNCGKVSKLPYVWTREVSPIGKTSFKQYFKMHTLFEMTESQYKNDIGNSTAPTNGSPATLTQLSVALADSNGGASATYSQYKVEITYFVQFYQRKDLSL